MKKVVAILTAALFGVAFNANADDNWNTSEHNYQLNSDVWGLEVRAKGNDDYDHVEGSYKLSDTLTAAVRYAEDGDSTEIRPKLTQKLFNSGPVALAHRIEYRYFEGNTTDDYWRYRGILKLSAGSVWLKLEPRWTFGGSEKTDAKIDDVKWQTGYDVALADNVQFTPFIEYKTSGEVNKWKKDHMILGTSLAVKF
jgi:hypothetical protein